MTNFFLLIQILFLFSKLTVINSKFLTERFLVIYDLAKQILYRTSVEKPHHHFVEITRQYNNVTEIVIDPEENASKLYIICQPPTDLIHIYGLGTTLEHSTLKLDHNISTFDKLPLEMVFIYADRSRLSFGIIVDEFIESLPIIEKKSIKQIKFNNHDRKSIFLLMEIGDKLRSKIEKYDMKSGKPKVIGNWRLKIQSFDIDIKDGDIYFLTESVLYHCRASQPRNYEVLYKSDWKIYSTALGNRHFYFANRSDKIYRVDRLNYIVEVFLEIPGALIGALAIADKPLEEADLHYPDTTTSGHQRLVQTFSNYWCCLITAWLKVLISDES